MFPYGGNKGDQCTLQGEPENTSYSVVLCLFSVSTKTKVSGDFFGGAGDGGRKGVQAFNNAEGYAWEYSGQDEMGRYQNWSLAILHKYQEFNPHNKEVAAVISLCR